MNKRGVRRWARRQIRDEVTPWPLWVRVLVLIGMVAACGIAYHNYMMVR